MLHCDPVLNGWESLPPPRLQVPSLVKCLFRRGTARIKLKDYVEAKKDLMDAWVMDRNNKDIRAALAELKELDGEQKAKDKKLFSNMLKGAGGKKLKPPEGVPPDAVDVSDDGGVWKRIIRAGDVALGTPDPNSEVQIHYAGSLLADGTRLESSRDQPDCDGPEPSPFHFYLGISVKTQRVIRAWDQVVRTMHKGEVAEVYCRADYAFGTAGRKLSRGEFFLPEEQRKLCPHVPPNADLKFEIELVECTTNGSGDAWVAKDLHELNAKAAELTNFVLPPRRPDVDDDDDDPLPIR